MMTPTSNVSASPLLRQRWQTINPAHAIQKAAAVLTFPEEISTFVVNRAIDAVRPVARAHGLFKEEPVNKMVFQIGPGGAQKTSASSQEGTIFQDIRGEQVIQSLSITKQAIRFETGIYTRWIAFLNQLAQIFNAILPVLSQATLAQSIDLEYIDFFYAVYEGPEDVGLIIDNQSQLIARRAFRKRDQFHSHSGWFDRATSESQRLINVDLNVADSNGPIGVRRTITIRTFESEQIRVAGGSRSQALMQWQTIAESLDSLHLSLKERLGHILTRDAKSMISLQG